MSGSQKVYIKIDSSSEQQETLKNTRKTLKVLQKAATDKENLVGRPLITGKAFHKAKSEDFTNIESLRKKKLETRSTQTEAYELCSTSENVSSPDSKKAVTAKDLTSNENPGEHYWEILAEKRRQALEETLGENQKLYERIENLEEELETTRKMVDEAKGVIEIMTEMLEEKGEDLTGTDEQEESTLENENEYSEAVEGVASTSGIRSGTKGLLDDIPETNEEENSVHMDENNV